MFSGYVFFYLKKKSNAIFANIDPFSMPDSANESSSKHTMTFVSQILIFEIYILDVQHTNTAALKKVLEFWIK